MAVRVHFNNCDLVGMFSKLTNSYCLLSTGGSENFYSVFEAKLGETIPIIHASIENYQIIGPLTVEMLINVDDLTSNKNGLLVPTEISDRQFQHIRNSLPDSVKFQRVDQRRALLKNIVACNDYVALVSPNLDRETEEILADTLNVEVVRRTVNNIDQVGSFVVLSNKGGLVPPGISTTELDELSSLLQVPLTSGTVNGGIDSPSPCMAVNDWASFCGMDTTDAEISMINRIFQLNEATP